MKRIIYLLIFIVTYLFESNLPLQSAKEERDSSVFLGDSLNGKYTLTMSLSKSIYKEFEPVMVKFELINNDKSALNINVYELFNQYTDWSGKFSITDDIGNSWSERLEGCCCIYLNYPIYELQPGDTLLVSLSMNNFGKKLFSTSIGWYSGYFPAGRKYKACYYLDNLGLNLNSNPVEFKVIEMNYEDSSVINIYKRIRGEITSDSASSIITRDYPDNPLTEYIWGEYLPHKYYKILKDDYFYDAPGLLKEYQKFFKKYPETFYIYDDYFMSPYYAKLYHMKKSYRKVVNEIKSKTDNRNLIRYLNNRDIGNRIKMAVKRWDREHNL